MNIKSILESPKSAPAWQGSWVRFWLRPDVFSAQDFIVGVAAIDGDRICDFRVISDAHKFLCIYGVGYRGVIERILCDLRGCLFKARAEKLSLVELKLPEIFRLDIVGSLRAQLPSESLERMLRDGTVPMEGHEHEKGVNNKFKYRAAESVVQDVLNRVRGRIPFHADNFIRSDYFGDESHRVGVNLVKPNAAGMVVSGWYSNSRRVQLEFLLGASKLEAYVAATKRDISSSALFFVLPSVNKLPKKSALITAEGELEVLKWQLRQKRILVVSNSDLDSVAAEVISWAECAN